MKKTNLIKMLVVMAISVMVMFFNTCVLAAEVDDDGYEDLTEALGNSSSNNSANNNSSNTSNNTANTNTNNTSNNTSNTNTNKSNNSSVYNNTSLPKTGLSDSIPVVLLVVVFGASAIYAYKKVNEYKNI